MTRLFAVAGLLLAAAVGCGDDGAGALQTRLECNPLGGINCVTPWPSAVYEVEDSSTATGMRLDFPLGALPTNADGVQIDPEAYNRHDGFSPAVFLFTAFPGGVDPAGLPSYTDYDESLAASSPTVLLDMSTGDRVAHFAEVDVNAGDDPAQQALYIRPAVRLSPGTRYVAAIRKSLKARDGGELPIPEGFAAILAGTETEHAGLERVRAGYDAIFAALEADGVPKDDLVVAWDFTTASDEMLTSSLLGARDAALAAMGESAVNVEYTISKDEPYGDGTQIVRRVVGSFGAPLVLTDGASSSSELARDANGNPEVVGVYDSPFTAMVPACAEAEAPIPMIVFGHGFFGDIKEAQGRYMRSIAADLCMVVLGTEWRGMAERDIAGAALALNDASKLIAFGERIIQGIVSYITLAQLARGAFATELLVDGEGTSLVDPSRVYYYGISQGHVLGTPLMSYEPTIERGVFAVGGGNWGLLLERSTQWPPYKTIITGAYPGPLNAVILEGLMTMGFDRTENLHVVGGMVGGDMPGTPAKQVLVHMAVGDSQVSNLSTEQQARELGIPVLGPALYTPWGLQEQQGPVTSALVIYDEKREPLPPVDNLEHEIDNDTHGKLREQPAVIRQIDTFWATGEIVHTCDGVCDCSVGNCE
jgi:hypothetical protein